MPDIQPQTGETPHKPSIINILLHRIRLHLLPIFIFVVLLMSLVTIAMILVETWKTENIAQDKSIPGTDSTTDSNKGYYPSKTCPSKIIQESSATAYALTGTVQTILKDEDSQWVKDNCPAALWVYESHQENAPSQYGIPSCILQNEYFSISPIDLTYVTRITPLGTVDPVNGQVFGANHVTYYLELSTTTDGQIPRQVPVTAPADIWVTSITVHENADETPPLRFYDIEFSPCREFTGKIAGLTSLTSWFEAALIAPFSNEITSVSGGIQLKSYKKNVEMRIKTGEQIGSVGGRPGSETVDFAAVNNRMDGLELANPARWSADEKYTVCPLDYFTAETKELLQAKLANVWGDKPLSEPVCGQPNQDKAGTARGAWFVKGTKTTTPQNPHLALGKDPLDISLSVFSVGTSISGLNPGIYYFTATKSGTRNLDFQYDVSGGTVYCYQVDAIRPRTYPRGVRAPQPQPAALILQLLTDTTLRIEKLPTSICGAGPWTFTDTFTDFER